MMIEHLGFHLSDFLVKISAELGIVEFLERCISAKSVKVQLIESTPFFGEFESELLSDLEID